MATSSTTGQQTLDRGQLDALRSKIRGEIILPDDAAYDEARHVFNAMIDRHPAVIVRCNDVADVISAVNFGRQAQLNVSVRGGSHNVTGFAVNDGGLVIDLSHMRSVWVDLEQRIARIEGGATWGDVDHATHAFGLAAPAGIISTTGVGLLLGGGIGYLTRPYGLSCDNLLSADIVLANGTLVTASPDHNPDLFWALRGGGGNFGVVTSLTLQLHPVDTVIGGPILYPIEKCREALQLFRETMASTPEDFNAFFAFLIVPDVPAFPEALRNQRVCGIVVCYTGPQEQAEGLLKPLRDFGPALDAIGPLPLPMLNSMFDFTMPVGKLHHYWKADYINELSDAAIDVHAQFGPQTPYGSSAMHIYSTGGAAQRVKPDETAYSYRDANFVHIILAAGEDPADTPRGRQWVRDYWEALHPLSAGGAYVNFLMDEGDERIRATYRDNYDRLVAVKRQYDPTNLFNQNQNIRP
ncbi:MAG TPA: FAD-binding oxidoreductase [Ktedonobacterales bacterium]|jgi:FAD/FMN-containing dehydrogenase|nr:FAD-binding oxidoreductase [Ktedonobacterales bacterium]